MQEQMQKDIAEAVDDAVEWGKETGRQVAQAAEDAYKAGKEALNDAGEFIAEKKEQAGAWVDEKKKQAGDWVDQKVDDVKDGAAQLAKSADESVRQAGRGLRDGVKEAFADAKVRVPEKKDRSQALKSEDNATRQIAQGEDFVDDITRGAAEIWNEAVDTTEGLASKAYKGVKNLYNTVTGWFK